MPLKLELLSLRVCVQPERRWRRCEMLEQVEFVLHRLQVELYKSGVRVSFPQCTFVTFATRLFEFFLDCHCRVSTSPEPPTEQGEHTLPMWVVA